MKNTSMESNKIKRVCVTSILSTGKRVMLLVVMSYIRVLEN